MGLKSRSTVKMIAPNLVSAENIARAFSYDASSRLSLKIECRGSDLSGLPSTTRTVGIRTIGSSTEVISNNE